MGLILDDESSTSCVSKLSGPPLRFLRCSVVGMLACLPRHAWNSKRSELSLMLPVWMPEEGRVATRREIGGAAIFQARGRHRRESGEAIEIQITDLREHSSEDLVKSMGFNPSFQESEEEGFTLRHHEDTLVINNEYQHQDQSGNLRIWVADRYLVELSIENLPHETFQDLLENDLPSRLFQP